MRKANERRFPAPGPGPRSPAHLLQSGPGPLPHLGCRVRAEGTGSLSDAKQEALGHLAL